MTDSIALRGHWIYLMAEHMARTPSEARTRES